MSQKDFRGKKVNIIDGDVLARVVTDLSCGKVIAAEIDASHFWMPYTDTHPMHAIEYPENFPECCSYHKGLGKEVKQWFDKFPNCCTNHSKLSAAKWFDKNNYSDIVQKILFQVFHTVSFIKNRIDSEDWYEDITDYIDYNVDSFGQLPTGFGPPVGLEIYLQNLRHCVKDSFTRKYEFDKVKSNRLLEFIDSYYSTKGDSRTSLNDLLTTYGNWLAAFPFEIEYFATHKKYYSENAPLLDGKTSFNKYTRAFKIKLQTKSSLIAFLIETTKKLLKGIDTTSLLRTGKITDTDKYKIDLIFENHRLDQTKRLLEYSVQEKKYVDILRTWLSAEKNMFSEIEPLLNKIRSEKPESAPAQIVGKPVFKATSLSDIHKYLADHFDESQRDLLIVLLKTGNDAKEKLVFKDSGKRLGYAFKILKENDIITSCTKQDLEAWVIRNFQYVHGQKVKDFSPDYIEKCISRNEKPPKNSLFEIEKGLLVLRN